MKHSHLYIGIVVLILAIALGIFAWVVTDVHYAPEVQFTVIDGRKIALSDLRGKPVLLNFWATTCAPCLKEEPTLAALYTELHPKGLEMVAVAMSYDTPARVDDYRRRNNVPYPIALDLDGTIARTYAVKAIPRSLVIAPDGRVLYDHTGIIDPADIRDALSRMNRR